MKYTQLNLTINGCTQPHNLFITGLGKQKVILGYPWFKQKLIGRNVPLLGEKNRTTANPIKELDDEGIGNTVLIPYIEEMKTKVWINAKGNMATELAIKENEKKAKLTNEELVLDDLHEFLNVLMKTKPTGSQSPVWDHKIDMKEGFKPKSFKNCNLTPEEQKELDKFLDKNLEKGYIQPSQSPMASPFFVKKKRWEITTLSRLLIFE